jgi:hypothetical protein
MKGDRPLALRINPEKLESGKILSGLTGLKFSKDCC